MNSLHLPAQGFREKTVYLVFICMQFPREGFFQGIKSQLKEVLFVVFTSISVCVPRISDRVITYMLFAPPPTTVTDHRLYQKQQFHRMRYIVHMFVVVLN